MFRMDSNINKPIDYFVLIFFRQGRRYSSKGLEEIIDRKKGQETIIIKGRAPRVVVRFLTGEEI